VCGFCDITNKADDEVLSFEESDFNGVVNDVWNGSITKYSLPVSIYLKTAETLNKGVYKGFGKNILSVEWGKPDYLMLKDLTDNIYMFSGAKTYQQIRSLTDLLKRPDVKSNFYKFKDLASELLTDYNVNYLKAEYKTAIGSSRMAAEWVRIQSNKDLLPFLQYKTAGDGRVRPEHAALDGIIRRIEDPFWNTLYPPNGWNCRCLAIQLESGAESNLSERGDLYQNVPNEFKMNSGKDRIIFKEDGEGKHPYFVIPKEDKKFAKKNFNLPIPNDKV